MLFNMLVLISFVMSTFAGAVPAKTEYGVDYSYPIHHYIDKKVSPLHAQFYDEKMAGCYKEFSKNECDATERARLEMNLAQPATQHNYTSLGFKKMKAPPEVWEPLLAFYEQNKNNQHLESWPRGYTYVNTWESPSYMISLEDRSLRGGLVVKQQIWDGVQPIIEEWTGKKQTTTSLYGIRVYRDKAILATHVDRLPLVSSCIINVAQDVNEPWPIEVYDHDGNAHNVTMEPGDMVLYESHTVLHGRPFPMNGNHYANVFVHFQPVDHEDTQRREIEERNLEAARNKKPLFANPFAAKKPIKRKIGGHEQDQHDASDIQKHLDQILHEEKHGKKPVHPPVPHSLTHSQPKINVDKEFVDKIVHPFTSGAKTVSKAVNKAVNQAVREVKHTLDPESPDEEVAVKNEKQFLFDEKLYPKPELLRRVAARGDFAGLARILKEGPAATTSELLLSADDNGWQAIHEAVRSGSLDAVRLLVESGADLGSRVAGGGSALWVARNTLPDSSEVTAYLLGIGAPDDMTGVESELELHPAVEEVEKMEEAEEAVPEEEREGEEEEAPGAEEENV